MEFIKKNILTSSSAVLALICYILPFDSLALIFTGCAVASFVFESGNSDNLSNKLIKLLKL